MISKCGIRISRLAAAVGLLMAICVSAMAQQVVDVPEFSGDALWRTFSNRYVICSLGVSGNVKPWPKTNGSIVWDIPGRFGVTIAEGDPETNNDNNVDITYAASLAPCHYFGNLKIKVGDTMYFVGDSATGSWTKRPLTYDVPPAGLGQGRTGGFIDGEWTCRDATGPLATLRIRMSIVRDQVKFDLTLVNLTAVSQSVGFEMVGDVEVGAAINMGYPYIAGKGYRRQASSVLRPLGMLISGSNVPDMFETMDSVDSPVVVARNTLRLQDAVAPDYVAIGEYADLVPVNMWIPTDYKPDPLKPVDDLAWVLCWNQKALGPGATRKIVTYYGVGAATASWNYRVGSRMQPDSVALAVQGPRSVKYDSTTLGQNDLSPYPFTVSTFVYNLATDPGPYSLDDVNATIYLPPGLELAPQQSASQNIGRVPVNSEALPVTWNVQATGQYSGELEYFVTARDVSGWQQITGRKVMVPATKQSMVKRGYQLMHVPFGFNNPRIDHVFSLPSGSFRAWYWSPSTSKYVPVEQVQAGQAFWMYAGSLTGNTQAFDLPDDAAITGEDSGKQLREQYIKLSRGWNLVGNPFVYPMYWGQVLVSNTSDPVPVTVNVDQAVTNGWLSKTVFSWIPESGIYEHFQDNKSWLLPWRGYWVYAKTPVTLVFSPPVPPGSDVTSLAGGY